MNVENVLLFLFNNVTFFILAVVEAQQVPEAGLLLTELLHSANQSSVLLEHVRVTWTTWLSTRTASSPILTGMLRVIGVAVASSAVLGDLMEAALEAYFKQNGN